MNSNPHYINEDQSDIRGIKDGWYAMKEDGHLSWGPFSTREDCIMKISQATNEHSQINRGHNAGTGIASE
jgi:hypothetical protein